MKKILTVYMLFHLWLFAPLAMSATHANEFVLHVEKTGFKETGRYDEVAKLCGNFASTYPAWVRCEVMGHSAEGRPIYAMLVSKTGARTSRQAQVRRLPVVLLIGGSHAGEIDGKDAGLIYLRDLLQSKASDNPLNNQVLVFVPVFNVDGHEHRSRFHRPNQNGPTEQGERTTARRINLNRDWMMAQSIEMQHMLSLIRRWDPLVTVDLHVTDGIRYRHPVSLSASPMFNPDVALGKLSADFHQNLVADLKRKGYQALDFLPILNDLADPKAGFMLDADAPRYSHVYAALRNRIGVLVEDHAWDTYAKRIDTCKETIASVMSLVARDGERLLEAGLNTDERGRGMHGTRLALDWKNELELNSALPSEWATFKGYAYEIHTQAPLVGGRYITYNNQVLEDWRVPVFRDIVPVEQSWVDLPKSGYVVPRAWADVVKPHLIHHGLVFHVLSKPHAMSRMETMRLEDEQIAFDTQSFQGRQRVYLHGQWRSENLDLMSGSIFVPIDQAKSLLVAHLLEPVAPDSLSSWGVFNAAYEWSDHISSHRELELARWMFEGDPQIADFYGQAFFDKLPTLRADFQKRILQDENFRTDSDLRTAFWINQLPPQDRGLNLYPIYRTDTLFVAPRLATSPK